MTKSYHDSPSPVLPPRPDDPGWPEPLEQRCGNYIRSANWYRLFWMLRDIRLAARYAGDDARRNEQRRRHP